MGLRKRRGCKLLLTMRSSPLNSDGAPDIKGYNAKLASYGQISWHNCPWLSAECDLYRYVQDSTTTERPVLAVVLKACVYALPSLSVLARLRHLRSPEAQCLCGFSHSSQELSDRYMSLVSSDSFAKAGPDAQYLVFVKMMEISLWGNATDPSLLSTLSLHQIQSLQGKKAIQEGQARIASNNMPAAWEHLDAHRGGRVDIVLDNAGLELFTNLVYSLYLLDSGLASQVPLHAKSIPWFVSDVIPRDFSILLSALADPTLFASGIRRVARLAERLKEAYKGGLLSIE